MARRVIIRNRNLGTDVAACEEMIKADYKAIWQQHQEYLEYIAEEVQIESTALVPRDTGKLENSINVRVSKSRRYPGIIATATAKHKGFDYALIQEETEEPMYVHDYPGRMAHYLGGPLAREMAYWYEEITGKPMNLPASLQHAIDYIESRGAK